MAEKEYIEREAAINEQKRFCGYLDDDMLNRLEIATRRIPADDVRPVVRGKWLESDCGPLQKCSICKATGWDGFYFCPNCGADMREINDEKT